MKISSLRWVKQTQEQQIISILAFPTLADPDQLQIRVGGGGQSSRPLVKGGRPVSKKFFFGPSGLSWFGLKIRGAPPPGSASVPYKTSCIVVVFILYSFPQPSCTFIFMVHVSVQNVQVSLLAKHQQVLPPQNLVLHFPRLADFPLCVQYSGK